MPHPKHPKKRRSSRGKTTPALNTPPKKLSQEIQRELDPNRRPTPTLSEFYGVFTRDFGVEWRPGHSDGVQQIYDAHLLPSFGHWEVGTIGREDVLDFRARLREKPGHRGRKMSAARINKILVIFGQILAEAGARYGFTSPLSTVKKLKQIPPEVLPLSIGEAMQVIDATPIEFRPYVIVRIFSGMRTGEIDGLVWRNVDFERRLIQVRQVYSAGQITEGAKTTSSIRDIPFFGPVEETLREMKEEAKSDDEHVFRMKAGGPMDAKNFTNRIWNPTLASLGLAKRRPYNCRHTFACMLLSAGEPPEYVAKLLGHASTQMLFSRYSKFIPNQRGRDGAAFQRFLDFGSGAGASNA